MQSVKVNQKIQCQKVKKDYDFVKLSVIFIINTLKTYFTKCSNHNIEKIMLQQMNNLVKIFKFITKDPSLNSTEYKELCYLQVEIVKILHELDLENQSNFNSGFMKHFAVDVLQKFSEELSINIARCSDSFLASEGESLSSTKKLLPKSPWKRRKYDQELPMIVEDLLLCDELIAYNLKQVIKNKIHTRRNSFDPEASQSKQQDSTAYEILKSAKLKQFNPRHQKCNNMTQREDLSNKLLYSQIRSRDRIRNSLEFSNSIFDYKPPKPTSTNIQSKSLAEMTSICTEVEIDDKQLNLNPNTAKYIAVKYKTPFVQTRKCPDNNYIMASHKKNNKDDTELSSRDNEWDATTFLRELSFL